ncbi:cytosolic carboxypeptidase-like protein 5 isoform X2 [Sycon ciliatum]|uniref:cytosolic carboxypeptidase-like protein 5 isoform X2 n=1 Tax=Sycon ciliatum TaxID=27933 RepID=UPI0031F64B56
MYACRQFALWRGLELSCRRQWAEATLSVRRWYKDTNSDRPSRGNKGTPTECKSTEGVSGNQAECPQTTPAAGHGEPVTAVLRSLSRPAAPAPALSLAAATAATAPPVSVWVQNTAARVTTTDSSAPRTAESGRPAHTSCTASMSADVLTTAELGHGSSASARQVFRFEGGIVFSSDFDSGNLGNVERIGGGGAVEEPNDVIAGSRPAAALATASKAEFNVWTMRDNCGGDREGKSDSWFYFSVKGVSAGSTLRIHLMNFKQKKLFTQSWLPVFKTTHDPYKAFGRLKEKPSLSKDDEGRFILSIDFRIGSPNQTTWFAFTYPYSYNSLQKTLLRLESTYAATAGTGQHLASQDMASMQASTTSLASSSSTSLHLGRKAEPTKQQIPSDLYFHREPLIYTSYGRQVDLITLSSTRGKQDELEPRLPGLFPDGSIPTSARFKDKKVVFISARVHPGEVPSSHVFNGLLEFLLRGDDVRAKELRERFVFKLVPMLNPDGVSRGHFRSDTRGVNLNRVYIKPHCHAHPSIYAVRQLMLYHHCLGSHMANCPLSAMSEEEVCEAFTKFDLMSAIKLPLAYDDLKADAPWGEEMNGDPVLPRCSCNFSISRQSGLVLYVDLHAHANRQGCFMFGNHFGDASQQALSELFPKLCSLNSPFFEFGQCAFSESGMKSKEGSGRVAMHRATNLVHCYTLECHYGSSRAPNPVVMINTTDGRVSPVTKSYACALYEVKHFEQVGRALGVSILDLLGQNPWSRLNKLTPPMTVHRLRNTLEAAISRVRVQDGEKGKRHGQDARGRADGAGASKWTTSKLDLEDAQPQLNRRAASRVRPSGPSVPPGRGCTVQKRPAMTAAAAAAQRRPSVVSLNGSKSNTVLGRWEVIGDPENMRLRSQTNLLSSQRSAGTLSRHQPAAGRAVHRARLAAGVQLPDVSPPGTLSVRGHTTHWNHGSGSALKSRQTARTRGTATVKPPTFRPGSHSTGHHRLQVHRPSPSVMITSPKRHARQSRSVCTPVRTRH